MFSHFGSSRVIRLSESTQGGGEERLGQTIKNPQAGGLRVYRY
jgi:hypothetical protein